MRLGYQITGNAPLSAMMGRLSRNQGRLVYSFDRSISAGRCERIIRSGGLQKSWTCQATCRGRARDWTSRAEHRVGRNRLAHRAGDTINAMLAARPQLAPAAQVAEALVARDPGGSHH